MRFLLYGAFLSLLLIPSSASADAIYSGCDHLNTDTSGGGVSPAIACGDTTGGIDTIPSDLTLYGFKLNIHTPVVGDMYYTDIGTHATNFGCRLASTTAWSSLSTGLQTITLPTPLHYTAGSAVNVVFRTASDCTSGNAFLPYFVDSPAYNMHKIFYWSGAFQDATTTFDMTRTNFWSLSPYDYQVVSSTTPYSVPFFANGWIQGWKDGAQVEISYYRNTDLQLAVASPSLITTTIEAPIENLFDDPDNNFTFAISSTSAPLTREGDYTATWRVTEPRFSVFGFDFFTNTLVSTTTHFTIGAPTSLDLLQRQIASSTGYYGNASTTATTWNDCITFHIGDCMTFLFMPTADSLAFVRMSQMKETVMRKPPFGYWTAIQNVLTQATTTTASTTPFGIATIGTIFSPLRTGLVYILYFLLALWIFKRLAKFDFQA